MDILNIFIDENLIIKEDKVYIIYNTLNHKTNKFYIGSHYGYINDGYIGCGCNKNKQLPKKLKTYFVRSLKKHGVENFERRILKICSSLEEMKSSENYYLNFLFTHYDRTSFYNESYVSSGGHILKNDPIKDKQRITKSIETRKKNEKEFPEIYNASKQARIEKLKIINKGSGNPMYKRKHKEESKKGMSVKKKNKKRSLESRTKQSNTIKKKGNHFKNKKHTPKTLSIMSMKSKDRIWINNGEINKKVKKEELNLYLDRGFIIGQLKKERIAWNKGLTKETDERVLKNAEATSKSRKNKK